jgi:hypothetical protein
MEKTVCVTGIGMVVLLSGLIAFGQIKRTVRASPTTPPPTA